MTQYSPVVRYKPALGFDDLTSLQLNPNVRKALDADAALLRNLFGDKTFAKIRQNVNKGHEVQLGGSKSIAAPSLPDSGVRFTEQQRQIFTAYARAAQAGALGGVFAMAGPRSDFHRLVADVLEAKEAGKLILKSQNHDSNRLSTRAISSAA